MHFTNIKGVLLAVAAAQVVDAHTRFTNFFVDDISQGDGTCVRMSNINSQATNPVKGITSDDMACGKSCCILLFLPWIAINLLLEISMDEAFVN